MTFSSIPPAHPSATRAALAPAAQAGPAAGAGAAAAMPAPHGLPPRRTGGTGTAAPRRAPASLPPQSPAPAGTLSNCEDFAKPLALAANNYKALFDCVLAVKDEASRFHAHWRATGNRASLAAAQGLDIKDALLNGLYLIRLFHKEWLSSDPMISPQTLARVLPNLRQALYLCEKRSAAVRFPIKGLDPALEYLQRQVNASCKSLEENKWQASAEGRAHANRQRIQGPREPGAPEPDPFADVLKTCREFAQVVEQLLTTLRCGPARRRANPAAAQAAPPPPQARQEPHAPAAEDPAAAGPAPTWERSFKSVLGMGLQAAAARPAEPLQARADANAASPPGPQADPPLSPRAAVPAPQAAPAAGPSQAAPRLPALPWLEPLQAEAARLCKLAQAGPPPGSPDDLPGAAHSRAFAAWQAAVLAHDRCADAVSGHGEAGVDLDSDDPAVRRLQGEIDAASQAALHQAAQAARDTLAAFSQACHAALGQEQAHAAGPEAFARLAAHCGELHEQWLDSPLRPRLAALEESMEQYSACEAACQARAFQLNHPADVLYLAEQIRPAADRQVYAHLRNDLLRLAAALEIASIDKAKLAVKAVLVQAMYARNEAAMSLHVLLPADPLPDGKEAATDPRPVPLPRPLDPDLLRRMHKVAELAHLRRERSIELPADGPQQAIRELQAAQAALYQIQLTAQASAETVGSLHELAAAIGHGAPTQWPAIARKHAGALKQLDITISQALQDLAAQRPSPQAQKMLADCCEMLRTDWFHVVRTQLALETLGSLLARRVSANQVRRRFEQEKLERLDYPDLLGQVHHDVAVKLENGRQAIERRLQDEKEMLEEEFWNLEQTAQMQNALALKTRITCDQLLIQGKLLLDWTARALGPDSGYLQRQPSIEALVLMVERCAAELRQVNENEIATLATAAPLADSYRAQIGINEQVRQRLEELVELLRAKLPHAEAGSSLMLAGPAPGPRSRRARRPGRRGRP
jgi:hypothetical protein